MLGMEAQLTSSATQKEEDSLRAAARYRALEDRYKALRAQNVRRPAALVADLMPCLSSAAQTTVCEDFRDLQVDRDSWRGKYSAAVLECDSTVRASESRLNFLEQENVSPSSCRLSCDVAKLVNRLH